MLDLTGSNHQLEVVTTGSTTFDVLASFVDRRVDNSQTALGRQPTAIVAAGTAVVVSPPSSDTERGVCGVLIRNKDAAQATPTTVQTRSGGIVTPLWVGTLNAGEWLQYNNATGLFDKPVPTTFADVQSFTTAGKFTWNKPTSFVPNTVIVVLYGAGGGGGAGASAATAAVDGAPGGGGGACVMRTYRADDLPENVNLTVGQGGVGGIGLLNSASTTSPTAGGVSSFGLGKARVFAGGGGASIGGAAGPNGSDRNGGGGGGSGGSGTIGAATGGGLPGLGSSNIARRGGSGPRAAVSSSESYGEWGGGGGGQLRGFPSRCYPGGTSIFGGAGGGAGSSWESPAFVSAATGGVPNTCDVLSGTGGAAGGTSGAAPTAGADGADGHAGRGGGGGGGGGASQTAAVDGMSGGRGGYCGGGGGGGGAALDTGIAGNGGNGGDGAVFVFCF